MRISRIEKNPEKERNSCVFVQCDRNFSLNLCVYSNGFPIAREKHHEKTPSIIIYKKGTLCSWIAIRIFKC